MNHSLCDIYIFLNVPDFAAYRTKHSCCSLPQPGYISRQVRFLIGGKNQGVRTRGVGSKLHPLWAEKEKRAVEKLKYVRLLGEH